MRTTVNLPLLRFVTRTTVSNGSVRCAAVILFHVVDFRRSKRGAVEGNSVPGGIAPLRYTQTSRDFAAAALRFGAGAVAEVVAGALPRLPSALSEASAGEGCDGAERLAAAWREAQPERKQT